MSKVSFKDEDTLISPNTPISPQPDTAHTAITEATENTQSEASESDTESEDTGSESGGEPDSAVPPTYKKKRGVKKVESITSGTSKSLKDSGEDSGEASISDSGSNSNSNSASSNEEDSDSELEESSSDTDNSTSSEEERPAATGKQSTKKSKGSAEKIKKEKTDKSETVKKDKSETEKKDNLDNKEGNPQSPSSTSSPSADKATKKKSKDKSSKSEDSLQSPEIKKKRSAEESKANPIKGKDVSKSKSKSDAKEGEEKQEGGSEPTQVEEGEEEEEEPTPIAARESTPRTWKHDMVRFISLYLVPVSLAIPISLLLSLNIQLLTPLYNSIPLSLHTEYLYLGYTIVSAVIYWYLTLQHSAKDVISARVCFGLAALSGDVVAVYGRRSGSLTGGKLGPEWGAVGARAILGIGIVGGATGFALLCFDHISAVAPATNITDRPKNLGSILYRTGFYVFHIYAFERMWSTYLSQNVTILNQNPEKTILFISLLLTAFSLFLRSSTSTTPFPTRVNNLLSGSLGLTPEASKATEKLTNFLPKQAFPILLLIRIPLLILALRQQIFLRPPLNKPYITANGELRIISSERSLTGQIVIAENLKDGYRFLRCDNSILGGRWIREVNDKRYEGGVRTDMGDSIFATFNLQEIAVLAHRSDPSESLIKTLQLTTDLEVSSDVEEENEQEKEPERALIIGLGVGIAASSFSRKGLYVDIVEIDPTVYLAAHDHFELYTQNLASTNILDGSAFVSKLAEMKRDKENQSQNESESENAVAESGEVPMWDYVIQDCFSGGSVPGEMFTKEFWADLGELVKDDGIIAMNFAGVLRSKASKAVLVTLTSVFPQCRAFGDGFEVNQGPNDLVNMVVFCTKTHSPLLTFRAPTSFDGLRSPLRSHIYSTFHQNEIRLDTIINFDKDYENPEYQLERGKAGKELNKWQVGSSLATWRAMQNILTPEMWLAW